MIRRNNMQVVTEQPQASLYGLLSPAVTLVTEGSEDWLAGFEYETTDTATSITVSSIVGVSKPADYKIIEAENNPVNVRTYYPFDVKAAVRASTLGTDPVELQALADHALEAVLQFAIEKEFWNGVIANSITEGDEDKTGNRYLSHEEAVDVTPTAGTAVKVRYGQALLEQALGSRLGGNGVIHAPLLLASVLEAEANDEGALVTNLGTKVVAGAGYSNTGPDGEVAPTGTAWMYATGPVTVRVGPTATVTPEILSQAVNVGKNIQEFYVDRPAAVTWSTTPLYAVLVDLSLDYA